MLQLREVSRFAELTGHINLTGLAVNLHLQVCSVFRVPESRQEAPLLSHPAVSKGNGAFCLFPSSCVLE